MLNDSDLARLTNRLQIPHIVQDILDGQGTLTPDVQYGLHEVLSEYQPDSALLCIAISALKIAKRFENFSPHMAVMKMECERVIEEYADLWVINAKKGTLADDHIMNTLEQIPEDLESLQELLETNICLLEATNPQLAALCEIMAVQASAQVLIADAFIEVLDNNLSESDVYPESAAEMPIAYNDNVVAFPLGRARA